MATQTINNVNVTITQPPVVQASVGVVATTNPQITGVGVKGDKGDQGEQGIQGIQGVQGNQGIQGDAATIEVGTVVTADPGEDAAVSNSGSSGAAVFDFTIPAGAVWRVGTGAPSDAVGRNGDYYLDEATSNVYLKATDTYSIVANIKGEQGEQGIQGIQGEQGIPGTGEIAGGVENNIVDIDASGFIRDSGYAPSDFAPALTSDQNYVSDAELAVLQNTSGTNTGDQDLSSYATKAGAETLTNKRVNPRITTVASSATPTPDSDATDEFTVTALAAGATFGAPTGTPVDGQKLIIRVKDNGTARALGFNAAYRFSTDLPAPTTTVLSKTLYLGFIYNAADSKWDCLAILNNF